MNISAKVMRSNNRGGRAGGRTDGALGVNFGVVERAGHPPALIAARRGEAHVLYCCASELAARAPLRLAAATAAACVRRIAS